jgi:uncharacterized OsmC-like protein/nitroimidazol reductase NimA-like FMN-containing flavoprotein (pyridoxamine 5'-phosphate oxidase superfamily)
MEECDRHLREGKVGRVAFAASGAIEVFPVNYIAHGTTIWFQTAVGSKLTAALENAAVTFEIDGVDPTAHGGWSVMVKGICEQVADEEPLADLETARPPHWRDPPPALRWVRVRADSVTGRETPDRADPAPPLSAGTTKTGEPGDDAPGRLAVTFRGGESYAIAARGHELLVDQPLKDGGDDVAATPTELFVASLASCVAFYAGRYLTRHHLCREGLRVVADFEMATDRPARVAAIRLRIDVPDEFPEPRRAALLAVASHCTVHNSLENAPHIDVQLR